MTQFGIIRKSALFLGMTKCAVARSSEFARDYLCAAPNSSRIGAIYLWTSRYFSISLALDCVGLFLRESAF